MPWSTPAPTDSSAHHSARPSACATSVSARHSRVWLQRGTSFVAGIVGCAFRSPLQRRIGTGTGIRPHLFLTRVLWRAKNGSAKWVSGTTKPGETEAGTAGMQPSPRDNLVGAHSSRCGQRGRKQLESRAASSFTLLPTSDEYTPACLENPLPFFPRTKAPTCRRSSTLCIGRVRGKEFPDASLGRINTSNRDDFPCRVRAGTIGLLNLESA